MAIVKMNRFSLFVFDSDKNHLLRELQKFKYVHFADLNQDTSLKEMGLESGKIPEAIVAVDEEIAKIKYGIEILEKYDTRATGLKAMKEGKTTMEFAELEEKARRISYSPIYEGLKEVHKIQKSIEKECEKLEAKIDELTPWSNMDVAISELKSVHQCRVFMGTIPQKLGDNLKKDLLETQYAYFEIVGEYKDYAYILVISARDEAELITEILRSNGFSDVQLDIEDIPKREIKNIQNKIQALEEKKSNYEEQMQELSKYLPQLELLYEYCMNKKLRLASSENFLMIGNIHVIEGYVPAERVDEFTSIIRKT